MSKSIADLHAMTDEEVIAAHDGAAQNTSVGTNYWMNELERRSRDRSTEATLRLTRASFWLSVVTAVTAVIAVAVAIVR